MTEDKLSRFSELATVLKQKTQANKIEWSASASPDCYLSSVAHQSVSIQSLPMRDSYIMEIHDDCGEVVADIMVSGYPDTEPFKDLYRAVCDKMLLYVSVVENYLKALE